LDKQIKERVKVKLSTHVYYNSTPISQAQIDFIKTLAKELENKGKHEIAKEARLYLRRKNVNKQNAVFAINKLKNAL
tara:strand:- start:318 stop:548 length:231 start_codon:yes stop_codon:yes gene_type:complete